MTPEQKKAAGERLAKARAAKRETRRKRKPLGVPVSKLAVQERDGYVRRWINDDGGRIQQAEEAGYEFVTKAVVSSEAQKGQGTKISQIVGTQENGQPLYAFLMEIKKEWYDEDQRAKQAEVDKVDMAIKTGNVNGTVGEDGRYVPREGIKVGTR